ncbi:hypothetical protein EON67_10110 [archaeon]|nr:MAG: hypothetical protein EON67_10110 [archaeon]
MREHRMETVSSEAWLDFEAFVQGAHVHEAAVEPLAAATTPVSAAASPAALLAKWPLPTILAAASHASAEEEDDHVRAVGCALHAVPRVGRHTCARACAFKVRARAWRFLLRVRMVRVCRFGWCALCCCDCWRAMRAQSSCTWMWTCLNA